MQAREKKQDFFVRKRNSRKNPKQRKLKKKMKKNICHDRVFHQPSQYFNLDGFWSNYENAFKWQRNFLDSYWKQQYYTVKNENWLLRQSLQKLSNDSSCSIFNEAQPTDDPESCNSEDEIHFEVSDEFKKFLEISMKHKASRNLKKKQTFGGRKYGKKSSKSPHNESMFLPPKTPVGSQRLKEMKLLYGIDSPKIIGMETAMQLGVIRKQDKTNPVLWPVEPLSSSIQSQTSLHSKLKKD